jgi:hypothetical protein
MFLPFCGYAEQVNSRSSVRFSGWEVVRQVVARQGQPGPGIAVRRAVVDVLVVAGFADDKSIRTLMVAELREALDHPFTFSDQLAGRDQLIEIVSACCRLREGLNKLADVIEFLRPGTKEAAEVRALVSSVRMHEVVPEAEQEKLRERLAGFVPPGLGTAVRRAARYVSPPPRYEDASAAFSGLADFNAGPGELPPLLIFVELIAAECDDALATELREWSDGQVRRLRLRDALDLLRAELTASRPAPGRLYLVVVVRPDPIEDGLYELSSWRQDESGTWPPGCGETVLVHENEIERHVDALVAGAEEAWSEVAAEVMVEFVLPRALLNLPVHAWATERASGSPKPLFLSYPTVVRSLERMSSPRWHRVWRQRWESWSRDPSFERVYFCDAGDSRDRLRLEAILSSGQWAMTVLTESPPVRAISGQDELLPALRAGVPVIVWHPSAPSEVVREVVAWLAESQGGLGDLPALARESRLNTLLNPPSRGDGGVLADLVVLWDDPNRLLPLGETGIIGHLEGGADSRDRVS